MLRKGRLGEENMLPELDKKIYTCLEGKTGRILLRGSVLEFGWRLLWRGARGCRGPDSSDNESRLSVDWPFTIRLVCMRFSGEDSSAKLCRGGDVSELPPDLGPTAINYTYCQIVILTTQEIQSYLMNQFDLQS